MKKIAISLSLRGIIDHVLFNYAIAQPTHRLLLLKKLTICLIFILSALHLSAQIYLPGSYQNWCFYNYEHRSGVLNVSCYYDYLGIHSTDVVIGESTWDYNCHAFAWLYPDDQDKWIIADYAPHDVDNTGHYKAPYIYWKSGMYMKTDSLQAEIAVFGTESVAEDGSINHSAVRITNPNSSNAFISSHFNQYSNYVGWYVSKWGEGPLVIHQLRNCYDAQGKNIVYFKRTNDSQYANNLKYKIDGPNTVGPSGATFSVPSFGFISAAWSITGPLSIVSQNGTSCIIQATGNGTGTVSVSVTSQYNASSDNKSVTCLNGPPDNITSICTSPYDPYCSSPITVSQNTWVHFYCHPFTGNDFYDLTYPFNTPDSHGATDYDWTCNPSSYGQNPEPQHSRSVLIMFNQPGSYYLTAIASNYYGSKRYSQYIYVTPGWYFSMSPNPASSNVTVTMLKGNQSDANQMVTGNALTESTTQIITTTTPEAQTNVPVTYTVKIINSFGSLFYSSKKTGDTFTIPVDNLRKGNYLVQISDGKTVSSQTLIISR